MGHVVSEGIYNKVALSVRLKTFTQVCVLRYCCRRANTSASEIRRFIYALDDGRRLKRESEKERESEREGERGKDSLR